MDTTTEAGRIWGQQQRLRRCDDGPEELETTTGALVEKDEPEDLMTTMDASAEEVEETTRLREHLQWLRRWCVYGPRELTTTTVAFVEEDGPEYSAMTM